MNDAASTTQYRIQVASDDAFTNLVIDTMPTDLAYVPDVTLTNGNYYWRVRACDTEAAEDRIARPGR